MDTSELSSVSERFFSPIQLGMYALMLAVGVGLVVRTAWALVVARRRALRGASVTGAAPLRWGQLRDSCKGTAALGTSHSE